MEGTLCPDRVMFSNWASHKTMPSSRGAGGIVRRYAHHSIGLSQSESRKPSILTACMCSYPNLNLSTSKFSCPSPTIISQLTPYPSLNIHSLWGRYDKVSICSPGFPGIYYVTKVGCSLMAILLTQPPKC